MSDSDPENMQPSRPHEEIKDILSTSPRLTIDAVVNEGNEEETEEEENSEDGVLQPAYSMTDLVDGLDSDDAGHDECESHKSGEDGSRSDDKLSTDQTLDDDALLQSTEINVDNEMYSSMDTVATTPTKTRLVSDISGRFHVVGAEYVDQNENISRADGAEDDQNETEKSPPTPPPPRIPLEVRRQKSLTLKRGTLLPDEHIYDDVDPGKRSSEGWVFLESTMAQVLIQEGDQGVLGQPGNPFDAEQESYHSCDAKSKPLKRRIIQNRDSIQSEAENEYENVGNTLSRSNTGEDSDGWGSSEFESYEDTDSQRESTPRKRKETETEQVPPALPERRESKEERRPSSTPLTPSAMFDMFTARLSRFSKTEEMDEDDSLVVNVNLDLDKHPPPELPPTPPDLDTLNLKRRLIVASIVESESSYTASLRSLVEDYETPLREASPLILPVKAVKTIFFKVRDILQCHHMFHIELAETIRLWDSQQKIGNIFTASFSKSIVFEAYSAFVNNFSKAMETAKKNARNKQSFADFLKDKMIRSSHKLSLFGLMVKPVQRFPQFIMLLQDLLKHTPRDHHDRLALQMALTELEAMTHRLNETKRESESRHDVMRIVRNLAGRPSMKASHQRCLIRQDDCFAVETVNGEAKTKARRLFLFNDLLLCTSVIYKEGETGTVEKYKFKWSVPIAEVEVVQSSVVSPYKVHIGRGKTTVQALKQVLEKQDSDAQHPHQRELDDMLHDLPVLEHISQLVSQLRLSYEGLHSDLVLSMTKSLQLMIQQKSDIDRCIIRLSLPARKRTPSFKIKDSTKRESFSSKKGTSRTVHTFQVDAPGIKQDWLLELHNTKLGLDPGNHPGWSIPENQRAFASKLPLFVKPLPLDVTKLDTQVQCAVSVVLPSPDILGVGTQHLWVCSSSREEPGSRVTLVSLHTNQPHVLEVFPIDNAVICCAALVPGFSRGQRSLAFAEDTVWMGTDDKRLLVFFVVEENRQGPLLTVNTPGKVISISFLDNRLYAGLDTGQLVIYTRDADGTWQLEDAEILQLGEQPVTCLLSFNHEMWAGCGDSLHVINVLTVYKNGVIQQEIDISKHMVAVSEGEDCIQCMVKAAAGLVFSFKDKSILRLFHLETLQHLQDISIASAVANVLQDQPGWIETNCKVHVTCLLSSKGQLWIGTNIGCVLTLPLPRLEGVPQIKGRPSVAFHAHTGPVTFLSAIQCGASQLLNDTAASETSADSIAAEPASLRSSLQLDGVTETETDTEDPHYAFTQSEDFSLLNEDAVALTRHRWTSTPDLREVVPELDDVQALYASLLQDEGSEFDQLVLGDRQHRVKMAVSNRMNKLSEAVMGRMGRTSSASQINASPRCATLPVLRETPEQRELSAASSSETTSSNEAFSTPPAVPTPVVVHKTVVPAYPTMVMSYHANTKRAIVVASGGQGHINWNQQHATDLRYEDVCLLLWQCRL